MVYCFNYNQQEGADVALKVKLFVTSASTGGDVAEQLSIMEQAINEWILANPLAQDLHFSDPRITVVVKGRCVMTVMLTYTIRDEDRPLAERALEALRDRRAPAVVLREALDRLGDAGRTAREALEHAQGEILTVMQLVGIFQEDLKKKGIDPSNIITLRQALALHGLRLHMTMGDIEKLGIPMAEQC